MKKKIYLLTWLIMTSCCLTSCIYDSGSSHDATAPGFKAYEYVRKANEPLTDMLFMAYLSHKYFALPSEAERVKFTKEYFPKCEIYDTLKADGTRNWKVLYRQSDYYFEHFLFSETPQGLLQASMFSAHNSNEIQNVYRFQARIGKDNQWTLSDYKVTVKENIPKGHPDINEFDCNAKNLDVVWVEPKNDSLYCDLTGTIQMASHETPSLQIEVKTRQPLRAQLNRRNLYSTIFPWTKGKLELTVTDSETKDTDHVSVTLSGNADRRVLIEMNNTSQPW